MEIDGYFADTTYPPHFPRAFTPAWIDYVLRHRGYLPNRIPRGPFRYLDLGCGNGLQLILMAAACPEGQFEGTDANDAAIARASALAGGLGITNVSFHAETFAETLDRDSIEADYITGLGLLSWVSPENRCLLHRICERHLKPGGAAAFGYNALPGRASEILLQRMLLDAVRRHSGTQSTAIAETLDQLAVLAEAGALGLQDGNVASVLASRKQLDGQFLPHEYISEHWTPLDSAAIIRSFDAHGLCFAGSLTLMENRPDFFLRRTIRDVIDAEPDVAARERLIDIAVDQSFRRDVFVRQPAGTQETVEIRDQAWISATDAAASADMSLKTPAGRIKFDNPAARGILSALEHGPCSVVQAGAHVARGDRLNALDALMAAGLVIPVEPPADVEATAVNRWFADRATSVGQSIPVQVTRFGVATLPWAVMRALADPTTANTDEAERARFGL